MGVVALETDLDSSELDDVFDSDGEDNAVSGSGKNSIDARRRLEDKLEEMRLQRELRDYDFDD